VSDAGSGSRILRLRRTILLLFEEKSLKTDCFESLIQEILDANGSMEILEIARDYDLSPEEVRRLADEYSR